MTKKIKVEMSCTRDSRDTIRFRFRDESSRVEFFAFDLSLEDFASFITNRTLSEIEATVKRLEVVGKEKITQKRSTLVPEELGHDRDKIKKFVEQQKEGDWFIDSYIGSQSSIVHTKEGVVVNYNVYRFVDKVQD